MGIIIGADIVPKNTNTAFFENGDAEGLVGGELLEMLKSADYRIFNLETPLCAGTPIKKHGPCLCAVERCVNGIAALGTDLCTLANNHILDMGEEAMLATANILRENGIGVVGIGRTPEEAAEPFIFECFGKKIGVYACVEHEFSVVTGECGGANPIDALESPDHVASLKSKCDYVIVLYHGGKEYYRYPSPSLQKVCRKLCEKGADLVLCQHCHCIGCEEKYGQSTVVYGQGNFLFDDGDNEYVNSGLLVSIDESFEISYIPVVKNGSGVRLAGKDEGESIVEGFRRRSEEILRDGFIEEKYLAFSEKMLRNYLMTFSGLGNSFAFRLFNKLSGHRLEKLVLRTKYPEKTAIAMRNYIECEAHRELVLRGLSTLCEHSDRDKA